MTSPVAVPQEVSQSVVELPVPAMDQDVQALVEQKTQELFSLLEKEPNLQGLDRGRSLLFPHPDVWQIPPELMFLDQVPELFYNCKHAQELHQILYVVLQCYRHQALEVLSSNSGQPLVPAQT